MTPKDPIECDRFAQSVADAIVDIAEYIKRGREKEALKEAESLGEDLKKFALVCGG